MSQNFPLYIKHMVCPRCIKAVREEVERAGLELVSVKLGEVVLKSRPDDQTLMELRENLGNLGFEIIGDKNTKIINRIKTEIINVIHHEPEVPSHMIFSAYLAEKLAMDYSRLSSLFSSIEGMTIEKYIILQKVEKIKELIVYDELTFSEIAYRLGYSSSQHLSTQFKKVTGLSPSHFKNIKGVRRNPIDSVGDTD